MSSEVDSMAGELGADPPVFEPGALNSDELELLRLEACGLYEFTETGKRLLAMRIEAAKEWHRKRRTSGPARRRLD